MQAIVVFNLPKLYYLKKKPFRSGNKYEKYGSFNSQDSNFPHKFLTLYTPVPIYLSDIIKHENTKPFYGLYIPEVRFICIYCFHP